MMYKKISKNIKEIITKKSYRLCNDWTVVAEPTEYQVNLIIGMRICSSASNWRNCLGSLRVIQEIKQHFTLEAGYLIKSGKVRDSFQKWKNNSRNLITEILQTRFALWTWAEFLAKSQVKFPNARLNFHRAEFCAIVSILHFASLI